MFAADPAYKITTAADCSYTAARETFLAREARARREVFDRAGKYASREPGARGAAAEVPRRNFIDDIVFGTLAQKNVPSARLSTDEEFLRRLYLDLTGRLPSPGVIRAFLDDTNSAKRDDVIDRLLYSPEFIDRWTMWFGDLLRNAQASSNVNLQAAGRNAFYGWIKSSIAGERSIRDIAWQSVAATGNTFYGDSGAANFVRGANTPMGPIQDTYDTMLSRSASTFLGLAYYDCLLCHSGRGHLDQISLWASRASRTEAQLMAAFFSRMRFANSTAKQGEFLYQSTTVSDATAGGYDLNTSSGNRPARAPIGATRSLTPQYRLGGVASGSNWRAAFADNMVADPLFAINFANRLWKQMFGLGLVDPVDTLDPARLDSSAPPPEPWTLQATHPELLERLAAELAARDFNLREFLRLLVQSSAYQLSSRYDGEWKLEYVPLFARHYPRRLDGEEVHDALVAGTGVEPAYTVQLLEERFTWAMQLPEPVEPRSNGAAATFMNAFLRGNRDTQQRSQAGSIPQQLNLMNDAFVTSRLKVAASPRLQEVAKVTDNDVALEQIWLLFLSRRPTPAERERGAAHLRQAATPAARNTAIEDLAWVAVNKVDFLFSY